MLSKPGFGTVVALGDGMIEGGDKYEFQTKVFNLRDTSY